MQRKDGEMDSQKTEAQQSGESAANLEETQPPELKKAIGSFLLDMLRRAWKAEQEKYGEPGKPVVVKLADIEEKQVEWWWEGRIPRGKLTVIDGDPGLGKSWLTNYLIAQATVGNPLPGEAQKRRAHRVLLMSEDDPEDTIKPRLRVMGADLEKVLILKGMQGEQGAVKKITLSEIATFRKTLLIWRPDVVIIDPAVRYMGDLNTNAATEVRSVLDPLTEAAKEFNCAIIAIRHLNKDEMKKAMYRGQGSMDFIGAARSAFVVVEHPDDDSKLRVLCHTKINNAPKSPSLTFSIQQDADKIGRFVLGFEIDETADELLDARRNNSQPAKRNGKLDIAKGFLWGALSWDARSASEIVAKAEKANIKERTLERAKQTAGIVSIKKGDEWFWDYPARDLDLEDE